MRTASSLRSRHSVEVWVAGDTEQAKSWEDPGVTLRHLVTAGRDPADRDGTTAPSRLGPPEWEWAFSEVTDRALERELRSLDADIVVSTSPGTLAAAVSWARPGTALVHHERFRFHRRRQALDALRVFGPRVQAIVVGDEVTAAYLRDELGASGPRVSACSDPLPEGVLPQSRGTSKLITAAGSLTHEQYFVNLVRAFGQIAEQLPDWRLRIFGQGRLRRDLANAARKFLLFDRAEFPGITADMPGEWARASIAVVAARGSIPLVTAEAMAAGLPVVAHNHPDGSAQLIEHERNGLLVEHGSIDSLSAALLRLADDPALRSSLGRAAVESTRHLRPSVVAQWWEGLFDEVTRPGAGNVITAPEALAGARPAVEVRGQAALPPAEARRRILDLVVRTAAEVSDEWFALRPVLDSNPVVAVPVRARQDFFGRLAEYDDLGLEVDKDVLSEPPPPHGRLKLVKDAVLRAQPSVVTLTVPRHVGARATLACHGSQVDVEFWDVAGDSLIAPRANEWVTRWVRGSTLREIEVCGVPVRTIPLAAEPTLHDRHFKVDAVYTWVDGDDPAWQAKRDARLAELTGLSLTRASSGRARFLSRDELRYSMRSLHLFAPWLNHIYLVTDGQEPPWLDPTHPDVTVVDHDQILAAEHLPTFNSHAIETGLHRVPSLSEHFIYFNDDVLLGRPMRPDQFFNAAGQFAAFVGRVLGEDTQDALPFRRAGLNNRTLLGEDFGRTITRTMRHTPHPFTRQVFEELEGRYPAQIGRTAAAPFRSENDVSAASSLAQHYGMLTGAAYPSEMNDAFVAITEARLENTLIELLTTRERDVICVADHHDWALPEGRVNVMLREFFEAYYPVAAPWEK